MEIRQLATNFSEVKIGSLSLCFSYKTLVAFRYAGELVIHENIWGKTTGKHLNLIGDKKFRVSCQEFTKKFKEMKDEFTVASDVLEEKGLLGVAKFLRGL